MTVHHRSLDVFGVDLHLAFDARGWATLRRKFKDLDQWSGGPLGQTHEMVAKDGVLQICIRVDVARLPNTHGPEAVSIVAHEAFHAALSVAEHHSIPTTVENDETTAYLVGWITAWIWDLMPSG